MLSSILSRVFYFFAWIAFFATSVSVITEFTQKPIMLPVVGGLYFGNPGMVLLAERSNGQEMITPDTTINYSFLSKDSSIKGSGIAKLDGSETDLGITALDQHIIKRNNGQENLVLDTTITLVMIKNLKKLNENKPAQQGKLSRWAIGYEKDSDSMHMVNKIVSDGYLFSSMSHLNNYLLERDFKQTAKIEAQNTGHESIKLIAQNAVQRAAFAGYYLLQFGCLTLLLFYLGRLFSNFSKHDFFSLNNIKILKASGWLILIPQLLSVIVYLLFLRGTSFSKIQVKTNEMFHEIGTYRILLNINWTLFFLGLGILVLVFIFRNALLMKEEQDFTF